MQFNVQFTKTLWLFIKTNTVEYSLNKAFYGHRFKKQKKNFCQPAETEVLLFWS